MIRLVKIRRIRLNTPSAAGILARPRKGYAYEVHTAQTSLLGGYGLRSRLPFWNAAVLLSCTCPDVGIEGTTIFLGDRLGSCCSSWSSVIIHPPCRGIGAIGLCHCVYHARCQSSSLVLANSAPPYNSWPRKLRPGARLGESRTT